MNDKLSEHFSRHEFACSDGCGFDTADVELIKVLEDVRSFFGEKVKINSGARCEKHNAKEGGSPKSRHLYGQAADIVVENVMAIKVYTYLDSKYPDRYGIGLYPNRVHIDVRPARARWSLDK